MKATPVVVVVIASLKEVIKLLYAVALVSKNNMNKNVFLIKNKNKEINL